MRRAVALALTLAALAALRVAPAAAAKREPLVAVGKAIPDVTVDLGAGPIALSTLRGKPLVLNFWTTWCGPCLDELTVFSHLQTEFGDRIRLVTVSPQAEGTARRYLKEHGFVLPLMEDPHNAIEKSLDLSVVPVTIVVRPDGVVAYVSIGELEYPELQGVVSHLVSAG